MALLGVGGGVRQDKLMTNLWLPVDLCMLTHLSRGGQGSVSRSLDINASSRFIILRQRVVVIYIEETVLRLSIGRLSKRHRRLVQSSHSDELPKSKRLGKKVKVLNSAMCMQFSKCKIT